MPSDRKAERFALGDVLSVTTGVLVGPSHVDGIYRVLDHMEQRPHWTHELPEASERVKPEILHQHPYLAEAHPPEWDRDADVKAQVDAWVAAVAAHLGRSDLDLAPCSAETIADLPPVDPIGTLQAKLAGRGDHHAE